MYFLKIGRYDLTLCKMQTTPGQIIEDIKTSKFIIYIKFVNV